MTRRELMGALADILGSTTTVTAIPLDQAKDVAVVVIRCNSYILPEEVEAVRTTWESATVGTDLHNVKALVLGEGMSIEFRAQQ